MTRVHRAIIFYIFFALFAAATAVTLLVAFGYTFNPLTGTFEKTGVILLEVVPEDARLVINGTPTSVSSRSRGAIRLSNISSGSTTIRFEKDGYLPWQQSLMVRPGFITAPEPIHLIKTTQAFLTFPYQIGTATSSFRRQWVVAALPGATTIPSVILFDTTRGAVQFLPPLNSAYPWASSLSITGFQWSMDDTAILIELKQGLKRFVVVYSIESQSYQDVVPLQSTEIIRWGVTSDELLIVRNGQITTRTVSTNHENFALSSSAVVDTTTVNEQTFVLSQKSTGLAFSEIGKEPLSTILPNTSHFVQSIFPFPLIQTPTLALVLKLIQGEWRIVNEIPASDGIATMADEVITFDHGTFYRIRSTTPELSFSRVLGGTDTPTIRFETLPMSPWIVADVDSHLVLLTKPSISEEQEQLKSIPPPPLPLEEGFRIHNFFTDPDGRRMLLSGQRADEAGMFLRLLRD